MSGPACSCHATISPISSDPVKMTTAATLTKSGISDAAEMTDRTPPNFP